MKLYYLPGACSLADHIALKWTGAQHEAIRMDRDSLRSEQYLAMNPKATVPLLVDGDFLLTENVAILSYIADRFPAAGLWGGTGIQARAHTLQWIAYLSSDVQGSFKPLVSPAKLCRDESQFASMAELAKAQVSRHLQHLDRQMEGRSWVMGNRSVADPYLFVVLRWSIRKDISLHEFRNLRRFLDRMFADAGAFSAVAEEEDQAA